MRRLAFINTSMIWQPRLVKNITYFAIKFYYTEKQKSWMDNLIIIENVSSYIDSYNLGRVVIFCNFMLFNFVTYYQQISNPETVKDV